MKPRSKLAREWDRFLGRRMPATARRRLPDFLTTCRDLGISTLGARYLDRYPVQLDIDGGSITHDVLATGGYQTDTFRAASETWPVSDLTLLNVGANVGTTVLNAHHFGMRKFVALEPVGRNFRLLSDNLRAVAGDAEVALHHAAAAATAGTLEINLHPASGGRHSFRSQFSGKTETVNVIALDSLTIDGDILLWIDTEGYETEVIKGATRLLRDQVRFACMEVSPGLMPPGALDAMIDTLETAGFDVDRGLVQPATSLAALRTLGPNDQMDVLLSRKKT
mgnify:CR=1 FL=1